MTTIKRQIIKEIKAECLKQSIVLKNQIAYILATVEHETNKTFKPVCEAYWLKDPDAYLKTHHANYYPYYGRGYVQLTWKRNYKKYGELLGVDLLDDPDLALDPEMAKFILVHGFKTGAFTGVCLQDYVNRTKSDFVNARRCINGLDKTVPIAILARKYEAELNNGII